MKLLLHNYIFLASNVAEHTLSATFVRRKGLTIDKSRFDLPDSVIAGVGNPERIIADHNPHGPGTDLKD